MISIEHISKKFGNKIVLNDISLNIAEKGVHGILGPNGCGKTTLIKCMLGLTRSDQGKVLLNGKNLPEQRDIVSWLPQHPEAPPNTTPRGLFELIEGLRTDKPIYKESLIKEFNFTSEMDKKMDSLSGGNYQKTFLILTLMYDLPIIILDEPTVGLDPMSAAKFKTILKDRAKQAYVLLVSHITSEIEQLSDQIHLLLYGKFIFNGSQQELLNQQVEDQFENALIKLVNSYEKI